MIQPPRGSADSFRLRVESLSLSNGLRVLLHPDDGLPIVAVHVCYHVGSKDESPSLTGLAHLFEHLMFEGSALHDQDYFRPLQEAGAAVNGSTGHDYTSYYEVVPANFLERALWLEADRMGRLLEALTPAKLENQRSVVKNERLQRIDNQPYGRVAEEAYALLYEADHPYHWPIIGWMEHLDAINLEDVRAFFQRYYAPSNAVLVLSGSFDRDEALGWIEKYFGSIPSGPKPPRLAPRSTPPRGEYRRMLEEPVALGRIDLLWPTVPRFHPDEPALDLASLILGDGKDSPLRMKLEREEKLAHSIDAYHSTLALAGHLGVWAYALQEVSPERVEAKTNAVLAESLTREVAADDLIRAKRWFTNRAYSRVETVLGKAEMIQHYAFHRGEINGDELAEEVGSYERVSAADIRRVLEEFVRSDRVVVTVRPGAASAPKEVGKSTSELSAKHRIGIISPDLPSAGPAPGFVMPRAVSGTLGPLTMLAQRSPKLPRVTMQLILDAGSAREPLEKLGLARLTADCTDEGTATRSGLEIARRLEILGASLSIASGIETVTVSVRSLTSVVGEVLEVLGDVLAHPAFVEADVVRERDRLLAELAHRRRQPRGLADDAIDEILFGALHPYGRPSEGTPETVAGLGPADLAGHHRSLYSPRGASFVVVGDFESERFADLASHHLSDWLGRPEASAERAPVAIQPAPESLRFIARPEATQAVLRVGRGAPDRKTPDYEALVLLNMIVGGQFSSRLNAKLREEQGFTYGVSSSFVLRRKGGSFLAGTDVDCRVTRDALESMLRVLRGVGADQPITAEELTFAKSYLTRRFPSRFETQSSLVGQLAHLLIYDLPENYYEGYLERIAAVTLADVNRAAEQHLSGEGWKVVVVGRPDDEAGVQSLVGEILG